MEMDEKGARIVMGTGSKSQSDDASLAPNRTQVLQLLASAPVLRGLTLAEVAELFREVRHRQISPGTTFHQPGDAAEVLYFLKRGHVRQYRLTSGGKKVILSELRSPTVFGSMALFGEGMDGDFAEAVEESLICAVSRPVLERLLRRRPEVALRLLDLMGRRLWELERRVEEMATLTTRQRVAAVLVRLADAKTGLVGGLTQEELAEMSGTIRQTVARILGEWQRQGLIQLERRSVCILHRRKLAALSAL